MSRFILAAAMAATLATLAGGCDLPLSDGPPVVGQGNSTPPTLSDPPELWFPITGDRLAHADSFHVIGTCASAPCRLWADGRPTTGGAWATPPHPTFKVVVEAGVATANGGEVISKNGRFEVAASGLMPGWWTIVVGQGPTAVQNPPPWGTMVPFDTSTFEVYDGPQ